MADDKTSNDPLIKLSGEQLASGLWEDTTAINTPLWKVGENIRFTRTGVATSLGWASIFTEQDTIAIRGMTQLVDSGVQKLYFGDTGNIWESVAAATPTAKGTGYTGTLDDTVVSPASTWSMTPFGTWVCATNGKDVPQLKKASGFEPIFGHLTGVDVTTAGTGYSVSDPVTISGGGGSGATAEVASVGGSGEITAVTLLTAGSGYTTIPSATAGGAGSGAVLEATAKVQSFSTAEVFLKKFGHVLAFGLDATLGSMTFAFSSADDPEDWDFTSTTNSAGNLRIREAEGSLFKAAQYLGDRIAVYTADKMFFVNYVGGTLYFGYTPAMDGIGAVGKQAVIAVDRFNYGVSRSGIWRTDGVSKMYIDDPAIRNYLQDNVNWAQASKINGYHSEETDEVTFFFPTGVSTEPDEGWSFNLLNQTWAKLAYGRTSCLPRNVFANPILATSSGDIFYHNYGADADGTALTSYIRTSGHDFGDPDVFKELNGLRISFDGSGLRYRIGQSQAPDGTVTWGSYSDAPTGYSFSPLRTAGQYLFIEFQSQDLADDWELESFAIYGTTEGHR